MHSTQHGAAHSTRSTQHAQHTARAAHSMRSTQHAQHTSVFFLSLSPLLVSFILTGSASPLSVREAGLWLPRLDPTRKKEREREREREKERATPVLVLVMVLVGMFYYKQ